MKTYNKPVLTEDLIELDDIIAKSGDFGDGDENDAKVSYSLIFGGDQ